MVVCEEGEELAQVIAANYAFALDAGLFLIPEVDEDQAEDLLEGFYKLYDRDRAFAPARAQAQLSQELLALCGSLPIPDEGSITFIGKLPFGFAIRDSLHPSIRISGFGLCRRQWLCCRPAADARHWRRCARRSRHDACAGNPDGH